MSVNGNGSGHLHIFLRQSQFLLIYKGIRRPSQYYQIKGSMMPHMGIKTKEVCVTCSVMLLMLLVSMPEIWTLGHTRLADVSCNWMPSSVVRLSGRDTVRSPAAATQTFQ